MLSSFNQNSNQNFRFNLSEDPMNELTSNFGYHDNYNSKTDLFNQYFNTNQYVGNASQDSKMYSISEVDSHIHSNSINTQIDHNQDFDIGLLSSRLQSMAIKPNCNLSRSNSAHNSPYDNRITPRIFSQSTSNTPVPITNRMTRDVDMMRGNPPIMQLFSNGGGNPNIIPNQMSNQMNGYNVSRQSPVELIEYQSIASKMGFLVGQDLEEVLNRSATMKNSNSSRISNFFKHKHGSSGVHNAVKQYLVLGVRVPSKEHVSEIVGKEGKKIKMIRQTTGALIATPNEKEDHVFLIEAVPETALKVGQIIQQLADQISRNKLGSLTGGICGDQRPRSPPVLGNRTPLATATIGVPQRLVGKVIGTQGSIITTVQKETGTEIKSPPKDELRAPEDGADFEISVYENGTVNSEETAWLQIHRAKQLIAHLVMRVWDSQPRNSTPSSEEGASGNGGNQSGSCPEWLWPEVARMDDGDAKEIVDRILRSSKAKITPSSTSSSGDGNGNGGGLVTMEAGVSPPFQPLLMPGSCPGSYKQQQMGSMTTVPGGYRQQEPEDVWGGARHYGGGLGQHYQHKDYYGDSAFYDQPIQQQQYYYHQEVPDYGGIDNGGGYHGGDWSLGGGRSTPSQTLAAMATASVAPFCEDARFGSLKYIWRGGDGPSGESPQQQCQRAGLEAAVYGTIGDGRKRYSAASNSDDREDL